MDLYEVQTRRRSTTILDGFKEAICEELTLTRSSASAIFESIRLQGYKGGRSSVKCFVRQHRPDDCQGKPALCGRWMLTLLQGVATTEDVVLALGGQLPEDAVCSLLRSIRNGRLRERNLAISVLAHFRGLPGRQIARFLMVHRRTVALAIKRYCSGGVAGLHPTRTRSAPCKHEQPYYKDALFVILHSPPRNHGVNRTAWTMKDLHRVMNGEGFTVSKDTMRLILKGAGFRFRKAKRVLTSTDPDYRQKLEAITGILSKLSGEERFFSIDEFGPVAVKIHGGLALTGPGEERVVPQIQKAKGRVMLVGALELSTNQITHFYASHKSTDEMIQLLHILLAGYPSSVRIYLSWDSASWHSSKRFRAEVDRVNTAEFRLLKGTPEVVLAPLPSCAQFLNVIESVFSGMARAIIHNSNYASVEECSSYIDRYLRERNEYYIAHPQRAGDKIWGKEREAPVFSESNNCKDPLF